MKNRTVVIIGNPVAGRRAAGRIARAAEMLKCRGFNVRLMLTNRKGDAELFSRDIIRGQSVIPDTRPVPLIIAAGGDGTFNEVINGIACTDIPMAILPLGTTNVLAKELDIPEDIEGSVNLAVNGSARRVSLGKIAVEGQARFFLLMAGIGYDGQTVCGASNKIKKYSGKGSYIWSGLKTFFSWNPDKLTFNIDGKLCEGYSAIICNAAKYAGHFKVAPDANLQGPSLYAFIMQGRKRSDIIRYVSGIIREKHLNLRDITYQEAEKIEINGNAYIQIDGDYLGKTPATIEIVPDAVKLVY